MVGSLRSLDNRYKCVIDFAGCFLAGCAVRHHTCYFGYLGDEETVHRTPTDGYFVVSCDVLSGMVYR